MRIPATTSQTVGPYFGIGLSYLNSASTCGEDTKGEHIEISGQVFDGNSLPVPDAQLELWHADSEGRFASLDPSTVEPTAAGFHGFARVPTDQDGAFRFCTIRPGPVVGPGDTKQAPHIVVLLAMRGLLKHLYTRIYFVDETLNANDPILLMVPQERRSTLLAKPVEDKHSSYRWDIHLQGEDETAFFSY